MCVYGNPTICTYEGPIKHIDTGTSSYICAYGPHPKHVYTGSSLYTYTLKDSIMHRSRDYIYMYIGTHHISTETPSHVCVQAFLHMYTGLPSICSHRDPSCIYRGILYILIFRD